nr:response regulator [Lachnospiraceae bacterium]
HDAREFEDDTERFFRDLEKGERISLLLAPAFKANYPEQYDSVLGGLKKCGVNRIISVSFGADITTWGYLNYIRNYDFLGGISQPCPAVVSYIERYLPELLPKLFPVQSPLMCAAIYARKEMGITDRFAFISPCIAKKMEIEDPHNKGLVQYNVTFEHLMRYVREHGISGPSAHSEIEYGLGSFYPTPGGLAENVRWFLGDQVFIRQIEGERHLYQWMHQNRDRIRNDETPFLFIDALNCSKGCICGTAVDQEKSRTDDALYSLLKIREESKKEKAGDAWSRPDPPEKRLENYNRQFAHLNLEDYLRGYTDRSSECTYRIPSDEEREQIFLSMNKTTPESRRINCTCCGYESCEQMTTAIYNGFNHRDNCIYYEKTMIRELEVEKEIALEATRAKSVFLANMSHEIRTPINTVLGMDELILRETGEENTREYAAYIQRSGQMLLALINDILDFSRIEAGKMELVPVDYDLVMLLADINEMIRPHMQEKALEFSVDVDGGIPRYLHGDPVRLKQCITNLLTNAMKYTEKGEVRFSLSAVEKEGEDGAFLKVRVQDTGIGIRKEDIERLFIAFERLDKDRNQTTDGSGLGMNIVQRLLAMMGSRLEVESEYGVGSTFAFTIRLDPVRDETIGDYEEAVRELARKQSRYRETFTAPDAEILIVDDTEMNLAVAKGLLQRTQIRIDTALSGREALELLQNKVYDVLFFDHMMPEMSGIELLHRLKEMTDNPNSKKPCIVLTANAIAGAREEYLAEGFDEHMAKPINGKALELLLLRFLPTDKVITTTVEEDEEDAGDPISDSAWYTGFDGINGAVGVKNCGSEELYRETLGIYYEAIDRKADQIDALYEAQDWPNYTIEVHAVKSTSRIIGAAEFGERAQELENAGKAGDIDFIRERHEQFVADYRAFKETLRPVCEAEPADEPKAGGKPEANEAILESARDAIREAADEMDYDTIDAVLADLNGYELPPKDQEIFTLIAERLLNVDYEGIARVLDIEKST